MPKPTTARVQDNRPPHERARHDAQIALEGIRDVVAEALKLRVLSPEEVDEVADVIGCDLDALTRASARLTHALRRGR